MVVRVIQIVFLVLIILYIMIWLIASHIKSAKSVKIRAELEQEYQEKHRRLENEYAEKEAALAKREGFIALQEHKLKTADERSRQAAEKVREAEELKRKFKEQKQLIASTVDSIVAEREFDLERRERNLEDIIARRVAAGIRGKEVGINKNWEYLFRKERVLREYEHKILERAQLIADHLGVPLRYILTPREKKLVDQPANELTGEHCALREEHYALIDLVMSCPDNRTKDLLEWMQRFPQSLQR